MQARILSLALACVAAAPAALAQDAPAQKPVMGKVERIQEAVTSMRGLEFQVPVRVGMKTYDEIKAMILESFDEEAPAEEMEKQASVLRALGLIPADFALRERMMAFLSESIGGYYDPEAKELFLVDMATNPAMKGPAMAQGMMEEMAMAHELHHALQDQHFDLGRWFDVLGDHEDRIQGYKSLVEGEAQLVGMTYMFQKMGRADVDLKQINRMQEMALRMSPEGAKLREIPPYILENLMFPYTQGAEFVQHIHRTHGWDRIAQGFGDPPASTEQVLHPEKYLDERDDPTEIDLVGVTRVLAEAEELYTNTLGEYNVSLVLRGLGVAKGQAAKAAAGWDGDTFAGYRTPDGRVVVVWVSTWDSEAEAAEFERTYRAALAQQRPDDHLERRGAEVVLVHGSSGAELDRLVRCGFGSVTYTIDFRPLAGFAERPPLSDFAREGEAAPHASEVEAPAAAVLFRDDALGVSLEVPGGLTAADEPRAGLRDYTAAYFSGEEGLDLRVLSMPLPFEASKAQLEGLIKEGLGGVEVLERADGSLLGRPALELDFTGKLGKGNARRFQVVAVGAGARTILVAVDAEADADPAPAKALLARARRTLWLDGSAPAGDGTHEAGGVKVAAPEGFVARSDVADPIVCALDHPDGAEIRVVVVPAHRDLAAASTALEEQLSFVLDDFRARVGGLVTRSGREAYELDFEGAGERTRQVTFDVDGRRYTVACSAPAAIFDELAPAFGRVLASVKVDAGAAEKKEERKLYELDPR